MAASFTDNWRRALGLPSQDPVKPHADDPRFADPVWTDSPTWDLVKEWYLSFTHHMLANRLIQPGALTVAGEPIDLHAIRQPLYAVAAEDDHIAPWAQAFRTLHHIAADKRFVLSSSGHILGIVNPPTRPAKRRFWAGTAHRTDKPVQWRERTEVQSGSWWDDWMQWLKPRAGDHVAARPVCDERYPRLADAPGSYVHES